ncbi:MAG: ATP-binding protein [Bacteroidota bacterium]
MIALSDLGLVNELLDDVAIIKEDFTLIYEGYSLKKLLSIANVELTKLNSSGITPNGIIMQHLKHVFNVKEPHSFYLPGIDKEILIFPYDNGKNSIFFISTKEKIVQITNIKHELKERVKELKCLYEISNELEKTNRINDVLDDCAKLIENAFQFPDDVVVKIKINKNIYGKKILPEVREHNFITADIKSSGNTENRIEVYSINGLGFLEEEQKLIDEIAVKIATLVEKEEKTNYLEKQQKILTAKNDALLKMTEECFQKREKLSAFFKAISDVIVVIDSNFSIIMSNKDDIGDSGKCYKKIFGRDTRCENCAGLESFNSASNAFREVQHESRTYSLRAYPIFGLDGKVERVLEVCHDITTQKYLETQLIQSYKLASLGKLVAGVAHEINNPNTFILGNLKIVQEAFTDIFPILDSYYKENNDLKIARLNYELFKENISLLISDMINGANRTKKIVSDLRNFAKKDDGSLVEDVDLNDLIKNNLTLTFKEIKKHAQLELELCDSLPVFKGNGNKIEQVLLNLAMNASEAIVNDNGLVKIKTIYNESSGEIVLTISDNGIGMDDSVLKNIFDPFFTTKRDNGGTGLGLSISYGIIKDHGGKIEVFSKVGEGTTFTIKIPAKR